LADVLVERERSLLEANQKLAAIYNASADGLTLCRAIRNDHGALVDYQVLEVNKALYELTGATREAMLATPISQVAPPIKPIWFESAERVLRTGVMEHFDIRSPATGRWLNVRVSYVAPELIQQTFIDITDRYLLEEQRQHLVEEMNHRVMNNFQMVAGLLHLHGKNAEPVVRRELEKAQGRVQVLARFHAMLAESRSDGEVDMAAYIGALCDQLRGMIDRPEAVALRTELGALVMRSERAVPLVFILNELVTNALKYAFPPPLVGTVTVRLYPSAAHWVLAVADDGVGLAPEPAGAPGKARIGLGTRLVAAFVQQLEATLVTIPGGGLRHEITFQP
jgi:two-component sensor histidine kinase